MAIADTLTAFRSRPGERARVLTATQQAELEIERVIAETREEILKLRADAPLWTAESKRLDDRAENVEEMVLHADHNSMTTAAGVAGFVVVPASWILDFYLFYNTMHVGLWMALVMATLTCTLYGALGAWAVYQISSGEQTRHKVIGAGLGIALIAVASLLLLPALSQARAEESFGQKVASAAAERAVLENSKNLKAYKDPVTGAPNRKYAIHVATADEAVSRYKMEKASLVVIFYVMLAFALAGEAVFSPYSYDFLVRMRVSRLRRRAVRAREESSDLATDEQAETEGMYKKLAQIGLDYTLPQETIDRLVTARVRQPRPSPVELAAGESTGNGESRSTDIDERGVGADDDMGGGGEQPSGQDPYPHEWDGLSHP